MRSVILFVLVVLIYSAVGGLYSVYEVSEAREGEVVHVIRETGEWLLPMRHVNIVPSKPPLFHWFSLAIPENIMSMELALRLPSIVAAALLVSLTFIFASAWFGKDIGIISAAILSSTHGFVSLATDGRVDMVFTLFLSWSIFFVIDDWFFKGAAKPRIGGPLMMGLSVLAKGPLAYAVLVMSVFPIVLIDRNWKKARQYFFSPRWAIAVILPLLWYLAAWFKGGWSFLGRQLLFENVDRFVGAEGITSKPFYFYIKEIWLFGAPYSLLLLILLYQYLRRRDAASRLKFMSAAPVTRTLVFWVVVPLAFYSFAVGKRASYMLTLLPPLSILLAFVVDKWLGADALPVRRRAFKWILGLICFVSVFPFVLYGSLSQFGEILHSNIAKNLVVAVQRHTVWPIVIVGLSLSAASLAGFYFGLLRGRKFSLVLACNLLTLIGVLVYPSAWQIYKGDQRTYKYFAKLVNDEASKRGSSVTFIKRKADESFDGFFYYYKKVVPLFTPEKSGEDVSLPDAPGLYLARNEWISQQRDRWTARVRPILRGGRAIDSDAEKVVLFELSPVPDAVSEPAQIEEVDADR